MAARGQDRHLRADGEQSVEQIRTSRREMLAIVQHQQQTSVPQRSLQGDDWPAPGGTSDAQGRGNNVGKVVCVRDGEQRHPHRAVGKSARRSIDVQPAGELDGEPGLSRSAHAADRDQPSGAHQPVKPG
jgi:hypothetical protein